MSQMFSTVLVANRGEIAIRVFRTLRTLGIRSVAVYSDADAGSPHVLSADIAVHLGPAAASESYLSIDRVIEAAHRVGAQAIHPGYGFLSENADFAAACELSGLVFIGPPASAIQAMGDKIRAKAAVSKVGVPVVPGSNGYGLTDEELVETAEQIGLPVLLKPSAGGGGKGMREVYMAADLSDAISSARREARNSFGDETLLVERLITTPRHIEIQILADRYGNVIHLGERECSLQRRHQKVIEEAPSPLLTAAQREAMGAAACDAARACDYVGAGTVEFIVAGENPDDWFFMEMNTRLQVEHPVTEEITGLDLVTLQLRVAAGEPLPLNQSDVKLGGHAIEARVYAEDPAAGFLPTGGRILALHEPTSIRVDSGVVQGGFVGSDYDPMLSKLIAYGSDRAEAIRLLDAALAETTLLGLETNINFLRNLLANEAVRSGLLDTGLIARHLDTLVDTDIPDDILGVVVGLTILESAAETEGQVDDAFDELTGWRVGEHAWTSMNFSVDGGAPFEVSYRGAASDARMRLADGEQISISTRYVPAGRPGSIQHSQSGVSRCYRVAHGEDGDLWIGLEGRTWRARAHRALASELTEEASGSGRVVSPMPGTVTIVDVAEGQAVSSGQRLLVVEAMKMEHVMRAPRDGIVRNLRARPGGTVARDAALLQVEAPEITPDLPKATEGNAPARDPLTDANSKIGY